jgi:hypothetical protein
MVRAFFSWLDKCPCVLPMLAYTLFLRSRLETPNLVPENPLHNTVCLSLISLIKLNTPDLLTFPSLCFQYHSILESRLRPGDLGQMLRFPEPEWSKK